MVKAGSLESQYNRSHVTWPTDARCRSWRMHRESGKKWHNNSKLKVLWSRPSPKKYWFDLCESATWEGVWKEHYWASAEEIEETGICGLIEDDAPNHCEALCLEIHREWIEKATDKKEKKNPAKTWRIKHTGFIPSHNKYNPNKN